MNNKWVWITVNVFFIVLGTLSWFYLINTLWDTVIAGLK